MTTILESIDKRIAELQARRDRQVALEEERERKRGVQRMIIIGGGLVSLAKRDDREAIRIIGEIVAGLRRKSDKSLFEGWEVSLTALPATDEPEQGDAE